ncbi:MAG: hypothetical protein IK094_01775 [Treponema sp.]|nr:hypothetical protein [Treponema sp.]
MKLYDYILKNFNKDEPFFVSELNMPGSTKNNIRQALKVLCDKGLAIRYDTGIYYIPHDSPQTEGQVKQELQALGRRPAPFSDRDVAVKKYICDKGEFFGYYTGFVFANAMYFTTQVPFVREIASNNSGGIKRKVQIGNSKFILKKPRATITTENHKILQILDLLNDYEFYLDYDNDEEFVNKNLLDYIKKMKPQKEVFNRCLQFYPDSIYKTLYRLGVNNVLA